MEIINTNSEWRNKLKKDDIINALDNDGIWYEAIIVNKDENNLEVRFRGWSDKWNLKYDISSEKIAKRYEKVPDWTKTLEIGNVVEISDEFNSTWSTRMITNITKNQNKIKIIKFPSNKEVEIDIDSLTIAEPYTHCGYNDKSPDSESRKLYLNIMRKIFKYKIKIKNEIEKNYSKSKVSDDLSKYVNNDILSDIKFIFNDNRIIYAHKFILCARSEYFSKMFLGSMLESNLNEVKIDYTTYDIFLQILNFLYTGEAEINKDNSSELLRISDMLRLDNLEKEVELFF